MNKWTGVPGTHTDGQGRVTWHRLWRENTWGAILNSKRVQAGQSHPGLKWPLITGSLEPAAGRRAGAWI